MWFTSAARCRGEPTCLTPMLLFVEAVRAVTASAASRYLVGGVADGGGVLPRLFSRLRWVCTLWQIPK